ncbi:MAG: CotH kinase family protein [Lachnospiraceae bacterium]|nr:CotH kinase family protein [Lachnospiraceae bacterium]
MNRRFSLLLISVVVGAAALAGALLCERKAVIANTRPTLECTDENITSMPYFDLLAAGDENRGLPYDVESYSLGDGFIHLVLPEDINEKCVAVYIRDAEGNYLARREYDFSQKVMIGSWEVVVEHHTLPVLYFRSEDHDVYETMNSSETKEIICDGNMHICVGDKIAREKGWYREYLSTADDRSSKTTASLQGRGHMSWDCDTKKSYNLRLKKAQNLLGMGKNKNWNLIGNAYDASLLKNISFNSIATEAGIPYQPKMQPVDLYVDGKYEGVYLLTTKVSADKNRIPLRMGDYFYKMDPPEAEQPILYESKTWFADGGEYPQADLLYPGTASPGDKDNAASILQEFIDTIEDPGNKDLSRVCDVSLLARYYWIEEASMNFDAWQRSTYMYYLRKDGRIHMGPVWDMDGALGNPYEKAGMYFDSPEGWKVRNAGWYTELFKNDSFVQAVYDEYYNNGIREVLMNGADEFARQRKSLGTDGDLNYLFYGHSNDIGLGRVYGDTEGYDGLCDAVIAFYDARVRWIDEQMALQTTLP